MSDLIKLGVREQAVLNGDIYCSPRCGGGCTKASYDKAVKEADELAARLGPRWKPHVFENLGWHYHVSIPDTPFLVTPSVNYRSHPTNRLWNVEGYTAWINTQPQFISGRHDDPMEAMREALGKMQAVFDQVSENLNFIKGVLEDQK